MEAKDLKSLKYNPCAFNHQPTSSLAEERLKLVLEHHNPASNAALVQTLLEKEIKIHKHASKKLQTRNERFQERQKEFQRATEDFTYEQYGFVIIDDPVDINKNAVETENLQAAAVPTKTLNKDLEEMQRELDKLREKLNNLEKVSSKIQVEDKIVVVQKIRTKVSKSQNTSSLDCIIF